MPRMFYDRVLKNIDKMDTEKQAYLPYMFLLNDIVNSVFTPTPKIDLIKNRIAKESGAVKRLNIAITEFFINRYNTNIELQNFYKKCFLPHPSPDNPASAQIITNALKSKDITIYDTLVEFVNTIRIKEINALMLCDNICKQFELNQNSDNEILASDSKKIVENIKTFCELYTQLSCNKFNIEWFLQDYYPEFYMEHLYYNKILMPEQNIHVSTNLDGISRYEIDVADTISAIFDYAEDIEKCLHTKEKYTEKNLSDDIQNR